VSLSKRDLEEAETDEGAGEIEERKVEIREALVADHQATEAVEPSEGPLDDPAVPSQFLTGLDPTSSDATADATMAQVVPTAAVVIALVGMQCVGAYPRSAARTPDGFDRFDQIFEDDRVVDIGRREPDREWDALPINQDVALRARFATIGRVGTNLLIRTAPLFAGTIEPSRLARDQSTWSAPPNRSRSARCRRCHTPACCQSRKRRQHVTPLPQPSSWGRYSHGSPVLSTNRMPVSAARSGMRGRPPLGLGGSGGSSGAITSHSASLTSGLAIS
jgi:hypothetical protein